MRENKYFEAFGKPFSAEDVSWRFQYLDKEALKGSVVPYLDARAVADRLDSVVGQNRWKDAYTQWHDSDKSHGNSQLCTIYIYDDELKEWIGKTDGAGDTDIESIKGGLSDAFKRAAVKWNIGRYLYKFKPVWVTAEKKGKNTFLISEPDKAKLEKQYYATVEKLFGKQKPKPQEEKKPAEPKPQSQPYYESNGIAQTPVYEIQSIQVETNANGDKSAIALSDGKRRYKMYMYGKDDRLKKGARIKNVRAEAKQNSYGPYYILSDYDMAA